MCLLVLVFNKSMMISAPCSRVLSVILGIRVDLLWEILYSFRFINATILLYQELHQFR